MSKAVVILSGGLDSATALGLAIEREDEVRTISFRYGQRHLTELQQAAQIAAHYNVMHLDVPVRLGRGGVLMEHDAEMPHMTYEELEQSYGPSPTYVPFRNGSFISLAASYALSIDFDLLYIGTHGEDAHNWAYPDCTPEFIGAMQNALYVGTYHKLRLVAPFTYWSKAEIVAKGAELNVPFELTHSCYEGARPACGQCPTCVARLEAFLINGYRDPLPYAFDRYRDSEGSRKLSVVQTSAQLKRMLEEEEE